MILDNAAPTPVDILVTWAVREKDRHAWWAVAPGAGFDLFLHQRDGAWCEQEVVHVYIGIPQRTYNAAGAPIYRPVPRAAVYHGRVLAFSGEGHVLVREDSRRLVVLPAEAVYAVPECP